MTASPLIAAAILQWDIDRVGPILLQKSQIAARQFSRRKTKQAAIID
jgi:hypothetical protein